MNRILFLDIDGVLNSRNTMVNKLPPCNVDECRSEEMCWFDPVLIGRLNRVIEITHANIVVSSSWRVLRTIGQLYRLLRGHGVVGEVISATPGVKNGGIWPKVAGSERGHQIQTWLDVHGKHVDQFAIVDDDPDMVHLSHRLVQTSWEHGLQDADVDRLVCMLTSNDPCEQMVLEGRKRAKRW